MVAAQPVGDNVNPWSVSSLRTTLSIYSAGPLAVPLAYVLGQSAIKNVAASSAIHMSMIGEVLFGGVRRYKFLGRFYLLRRLQ